MKRILVADDDKKITTALSARLNSAGYEVLTASNGFKALNLIRTNSPDLILLDIWMPVGMGLAVAACLRNRGVQTPIIFLTASKKNGLWAAAQELGAAGFLEKPYDPEELMMLIERTLAEQINAA